MRRLYFSAALAAAWFSGAAAAFCAPPLRYWFWWEASTFDTYKGDYFDVMQAARNIYAPLVSIGLDGRPQGMAAEDWRVSADGRVWRFRIRKGLAFEDGAPITAQTALANFRRMFWLTRAEELPLNSLLPGLAAWRDYKVPLRGLYAEGGELVFEFSRRPDNLFEILSHPFYALASPKCFGADGGWPEPFCSIASGEYRVVSREPGRIRLAARGVYPRAERAPQSVEIRTPLAPGESALKAMLAGEGDLAVEPDFALSSATRRVIRDSGFELTEEPPSRMYFVQLNHKRPPFNDAALRRSVRDMFLSRLGEKCRALGLRRPDPSFMPRGGVGYERFPVPERAQPKVRAAGSPELVFFPLANYSFPEDGRLQAAAEETLIEVLTAHGLRPRINRYVARKGAAARLGGDDFDAILRGSGVTVNDPYAGLQAMLLSKISARIPDPSGRAGGFIRRANAAAEPGARAALVARMNRSVFEDAALINFLHSSWVYLHRPGADMSRFNLFMDPVEFRAVDWRPGGEYGGGKK